MFETTTLIGLKCDMSAKKLSDKVFSAQAGSARAAPAVMS